MSYPIHNDLFGNQIFACAAHAVELAKNSSPINVAYSKAGAYVPWALKTDRRNRRYWVSRRSIWAEDPPRSVVEIVGEAIPQRGLSVHQVANLVIPYEDCLWILLHSCGLEDRKCLAFSRICALRSLRLWTGPYPETVADYLRTGKRVLLPEARGEMLKMSLLPKTRGAVLRPIGAAESTARLAVMVPLIDADKIDLKMGRWTCISPATRAVAAAREARKAGLGAPSQINDLLIVMYTHPSVLARRMVTGSFEAIC